MTSGPRRLLSRLARRWVGERAIPVGGLARDRRFLRRALRGQDWGRVLVIGPGLAVRQVLPPGRVDVVGTSPYRSEVTVCSALVGPRPLPPGRWDTLVMTEVDEGFGDRLRAAVPACRPEARVVVFERHGQPDAVGHVSELTAVASLEQVLLRQGRRLWVARVAS